MHNNSILLSDSQTNLLTSYSQIYNIGGGVKEVLHKNKNLVNSFKSNVLLCYTDTDIRASAHNITYDIRTLVLNITSDQLTANGGYLIICYANCEIVSVFLCSKQENGIEEVLPIKWKLLKKEGGEYNMLTKKSIASAVATGTLLFNAFATSAFAATTIEISGNGAGSSNDATQISTTNSTTVSQNNTANVTNNVTSNANSGGNSANLNTGGDVTIHTGAASATTDVANAVNANSASVDNCNCAGGADVKISGNGAGSFNKAAVNSTNTTSLGQNNVANLYNTVNSTAKSGDNKAGFNTGGDVLIVTGPAMTDTSVLNAANVNRARVGSALPGSGTGAGSSAVISGNGAGSSNSITLGLNRTVTLHQDNYANINNRVNSTAKSGGNDANFNTGGDTVIGTGMAHATTTVDNLANFNAADLDCGCLTGGLNAKIAGNGAGLHGWFEGIELPLGYKPSFNTIKAKLSDVTVLTQGNGAHLNNGVDGGADSGYNNAGFNTGPVSDPTVLTGPASSDTNVSNTSNMNVAGPSATWTLPGGTQVSMDWNFVSLMGWLHLLG